MTYKFLLLIGITIFLNFRNSFALPNCPSLFNSNDSEGEFLLKSNSSEMAMMNLAFSLEKISNQSVTSLYRYFVLDKQLKNYPKDTLSILVLASLTSNSSGKTVRDLFLNLVNYYEKKNVHSTKAIAVFTWMKMLNDVHLVEISNKYTYFQKKIGGVNSEISSAWLSLASFWSKEDIGTIYKSYVYFTEKNKSNNLNQKEANTILTLVRTKFGISLSSIQEDFINMKKHSKSNDPLTGVFLVWNKNINQYTYSSPTADLRYVETKLKSVLNKK